MKIIFKYVLVAVAIFAVSCNTGPHHPAKVKTLDSLQAEIVKAETALQSLDTAAIFAASKKMEEDFFSIKQYKPDTIDMETALVVEKFLNIKTPIDAFVKKRNSFMQDIGSSKEQLRTLSHDLNKNLIAEEKVEQYFLTEEKKSKEIIESAWLTTETMKNLLLRYDSINEPFTQVLDKLKALKDSSAAVNR